MDVVLFRSSLDVVEWKAVPTGSGPVRNWVEFN